MVLPTIALLLALVPLLAGCGLVRELARDPAVLTATGLWMEIGVSALSPAVPIPLPSVRVGYGTLTRTGAHEKVRVTTGGSGSTSVTPGGASGAGTASGTTSLTLEAEGIPHGVYRP